MLIASTKDFVQHLSHCRALNVQERPSLPCMLTQSLDVAEDSDQNLDF